MEAGQPPDLCLAPSNAQEGCPVLTNARSRKPREGLALGSRGGSTYRALARNALSGGSTETRPELPDPATMSVEDLRAEVEGGRDAFEYLVGVLVETREKLRRAEHNVQSAHRAIDMIKRGEL